MKNTFNHIKEFKNVKHKCIFCQSQLEFLVSNFAGPPYYDIKCVNDTFNISAKISASYSTANVRIELHSILQLLTSQIIFDLRGMIQVFSHKKEEIAEICKRNFENLHLHLALKCESKNCKHNYVICSSPLKCLNVPMYAGMLTHPIFNIAPLTVYMESFVINDSWVQNLWQDETTNIYSVENENNDPIEIPIIDWKDMDLDKIQSKLKTLLTFS